MAGCFGRNEVSDEIWVRDWSTVLDGVGPAFWSAVVFSCTFLFLLSGELRLFKSAGMRSPRLQFFQGFSRQDVAHVSRLA